MMHTTGASDGSDAVTDPSPSIPFQTSSSSQHSYHSSAISPPSSVARVSRDHRASGTRFLLRR